MSSTWLFQQLSFYEPSISKHLADDLFYFLFYFRQIVSKENMETGTAFPIHLTEFVICIHISG